jgi:hypothetical protein
MTVLLGVAAVAAGVVLVFVALSRTMPRWARAGLVLVGLALIALALIPVLDFTFGYAILKQVG